MAQRLSESKMRPEHVSRSRVGRCDLRHLTILQNRDQIFEQLRTSLKVSAGFHCQQIDLALNLATLAVTLDAMRLERRR